MSPIELPLGLAMVALGAGSFVGFFALVGICALVERIRHGR